MRRNNNDNNKLWSGMERPSQSTIPLEVGVDEKENVGCNLTTYVAIEQVRYLGKNIKLKRLYKAAEWITIQFFYGKFGKLYLSEQLIFWTYYESDIQPTTEGIQRVYLVTEWTLA